MSFALYMVIIDVVAAGMMMMGVFDTAKHEKDHNYYNVTYCSYVLEALTKTGKTKVIEMENSQIRFQMH